MTVICIAAGCSLAALVVVAWAAVSVIRSVKVVRRRDGHLVSIKHGWW